MSSEEVSARIAAFIRDKYLGRDGDELTEVTPIIELGILDSLNTILLIGFIRDELGVVVPPREINADNFKNIRAITSLVCETAGSGAV
ncbi:acyl carrier protein [Solwaraspora sp. WMMD1047]|uniref:acyl carrier protein n=1 Tax=Solwaraspora sp. WMMD1047 TaxID=3016102 RepID=UPI0024168456|nr:acyl carrier protein [Solwaraspora sp. WMMD1047]MDG4830620.1 acyl carrier protein [Solwaraspora sp. WMMD1047]